MTQPSPNDAQTPAEIWKGDLFGRQSEAETIIAYLESVAGRPSLREDHRGFTLSIDADYGTGKSFFLKRLKSHLELNHPVAFVDAWTDDLADEPLTAIAATLKRSLAAMAAKNNAVAEGWKQVSEKTGAVVKVVAKGLLKKGASLIITESGANALEGILEGFSEPAQKTTEDTLDEVGKLVADGLVDGLSSASARKLMADRIANFEAGQLAIKELKASLEALVALLPQDGKYAPIVIIIDELDRCRPPYAIKLLEELKHLFDVPGIVFILGLNSAQLEKSIQSAYGSDFDGAAYLRRFIDRQYSLSLPDLVPLISYLGQGLGIPFDRLNFGVIEEGGRAHEVLPAPQMIGRYMHHFGLNARDAFPLMDLLQTCAAITGDKPLLMPILLPMIIAKIINHPRPAEIEAKRPIKWHNKTFMHNLDPMVQTPVNLYQIYHRLMNLSQSYVVSQANQNDIAANMFLGFVGNDPKALSSASNYEKLLQTVGRFSSPDRS